MKLGFFIVAVSILAGIGSWIMLPVLSWIILEDALKNSSKK